MLHSHGLVPRDYVSHIFDHVVTMFFAMCHGSPWHTMGLARQMSPEQVTVCQQLLELPWLAALEEKRWFVWPPSAMALWHFSCFRDYFHLYQVVPHKAVAEVSK